MSCWSKKVLSKIASAVGTPVCADECTSKQTKISYARMPIEINLTKELPSVIKVSDPKGNQFPQKVSYEWKPDFCQKCMKIGHICAEEVPQNAEFQAPKRRRRPRKVEKVWQAREQDDTRVEKSAKST
ncbi:uncharacterized protein LOC132034619 [Lycium ferocissimum]|uniref:uncharacterized protein LOC132034619 n=1 Tax=Lycium ferocissimum TaxID=112874 RepID=UPI00281503F9|nr:uncharacterized protein LOC132034619 [Lycium ferocissimum]